MSEVDERIKSLSSRVGRLELKVNTLIDTVNDFNYHLTQIYSLTAQVVKEEQGQSELLNKVASAGASFKSVGIIKHR